MNKLIISTALVASFASFTAISEEELTGPFITLGANHFMFDDVRLLEDETDLFIGAGYQLSNHWSLGLEYTELDAKAKWFGATNYETEFLSLNTLYRYAPKNQNSFFWKFGAGKYSETPQTNHQSAARIGLGYDFALNDTFSVAVGTDALIGVHKSRLDWVPYVGLTAFFGSTGQSAPVVVEKTPVAPMDSDKDGVVDSLDQCPASKANVKVDAKGCELDSDKDGVVDSIDQCPQTPAGAKVDANGCRIVLQENVSIALDVKFANNSNVVTEEFRQEIKKVADFMREYPDTTVIIEGHTDDRGSAKYNQQLSQKRADAVMNYLVANFNIATHRVSALGKGEEHPIATNNTAEGRQTNRRVQAEIKTSVAKPQ